MTPVGRKRDFIGEPEPLAAQVLPDLGDEDAAEPAMAEVEWRQCTVTVAQHGERLDRALATPFNDLQAFSPMLAILSARHEVQYSRLFRS